jgi:uncharacterized RDD family membrane protein YckC/Tfp pilus assembly protein PilE
MDPITPGNELSETVPAPQVQDQPQTPVQPLAQPQVQAVTPPLPTETLVLPASIWRRLGGYALDYVFMYIFCVLVGFLIGAVVVVSGGSSGSGSVIVVGIILGLVVYCGYKIFCESIWQRTLGKLIVGTKVVDRQGNKPSFPKILGRSFARLIPFEFISFMLDGHPIGLHDSLSGTMVVSVHMTPEQVQMIDPVKMRATRSHNGVVIAIVIIGSLLMFLAIIGILSAVVLASLNVAREKGNAAAIKSNMDLLTTQAAIYYDTQNQSYTGFCSDPTVAQALQDARTAGISSSKGSTNSSGCNDSAAAWAAAAPLPTDGYWCVDSTGSRGLTHTDLGKDTVCPPITSDSGSMNNSNYSSQDSSAATISFNGATYTQADQLQDTPGQDYTSKSYEWTTGGESVVNWTTLITTSVLSPLEPSKPLDAVAYAQNLVPVLKSSGATLLETSVINTPEAAASGVDIKNPPYLIVYYYPESADKNTPGEVDIQKIQNGPGGIVTSFIYAQNMNRTDKASMKALVASVEFQRERTAAILAQVPQ